MATGKGSGGEPLSCIQRFSGRKVIRELLFSMLRQYKRKRGGEGERWKCGRWRQEVGEEMKGEKGLEKREMEGATGKEGEERGRVEGHRGRKKDTSKYTKEEKAVIEP